MKIIAFRMNHENHENLGISQSLMKTINKSYNSTKELQTKNILEFHDKFTKIMKILEFNLRIKKIMKIL